MLRSLAKLWSIEDLRKRILYTLLLLVVFRLGVYVPTPGIDREALAAFFERSQGTLLDVFDMFSGGGLERFSVFALGIMPYISSSIIFQLLAVVVPSLEKLQKEGEFGRRKINQYTRYATLALAFFQGFGISIGLEHMVSPAGVPVVPGGGMGFRLLTAVTVATGSMFVMWIGERISERGVGNGTSLIIFAGIVAGIPSAIIRVGKLVVAGELGIGNLLLVGMIMLACIVFILFVERAERRIPIQYGRRMVGSHVHGAQLSHLPLKVNTAGVIPPIFASSLLMFPATFLQFLPPMQLEGRPWLENLMLYFAPGAFGYEVTYVMLIVFFTYFYTAVQFNPEDVADNLRKYGSFIPGVRPGKETAEYIDTILTRLTLWGALYLSVICVLPSVLAREFRVPFRFGGTGLLIVIGVALDTIAQLESQMLVRSYDTFITGVRIRGRRA